MRRFAVACLLLLAIATGVSSAIASRAACKSDCLNGGSCVSGVCKCKQGFVGTDCSSRGCGSNCNQRGYCDLSTTPASCLCFPGYGGLECELSVGAATAASGSSAAASANATAAASGAAAANASASSTTSTGLKPLDRTLCNPPCSSNGVCWQGACACANGFAGATCSERLCKDDCSGRGKCDRKTGECECYKPYSGPTCAGQSGELRPRAVDTWDDVLGPHSYNLTDSDVNSVNRSRNGTSNSFHLIEEESRMQQMVEPEYESLVY